MNIDILKVGYLETNCYILTKNNKSLIIDPGADENFIVSRIKKLNTTPIAILLTHHHEDHTGCVKPLSSMYGIKVYDYNNLFEGNHQIEDFSFEVIYTKGHSATSVTYYFPKEKVMFVGDFIFYENIGRTDLPTGDYKEMIRSMGFLIVFFSLLQECCHLCTPLSEYLANLNLPWNRRINKPNL